MKHTLLAVGILAAFALTSCKDEKASELFTDAEKQEQAESVVDPATAAVLTFESETYDFGNLPAAAKVDHYFKFTNTGKSPLIIKDAKGSCGCTVPEFPKEPIAPGATDSIKITYDAGSQKGRQQKTVTLTTNTVKGKEVCTFIATLPNDAAPAAKPNPLTGS
ncbi:DUF1573 domain-containing protein [Moheibacter lacus]|uniref:DUF1573 domain-containing protein n=1 Tax=Moheibacter lacus TaxID=2745851 RepID=A0A838ZQV0_9FLAO|nr:DUF1573 domain-containing protein [Moheibacter lacus]MBA5628472.1 DUF1573 domain-containing protein [Moheibacter lacus]